MNPRPYFYWKSFWMGLLVLAFLGWVWARSMDRNEGVWFTGIEKRRVNINLLGGSFRVIQWEVGRYEPFRMEPYSEKLFDEGPKWWQHWALLRRNGSFFYWAIFPLWLPFAGCLALWCGWLGWRVKRLTESIPEKEVAG